ncbi:MAG: HAD-IB family phosphatase [Alphaproteobacteria bacterium]|nr:HAD-IB family phosphatase [Alphaproteobacteria bacterium]
MNYVLTFIAAREIDMPITQETLKKAENLLAAHGLGHSIKNPATLARGKAMDLFFEGPENYKQLKPFMLEAGQEFVACETDLLISYDNPARRRPYSFFDMDSTAVTGETLDEAAFIAEELYPGQFKGAGVKVRDITAAGMASQSLDFGERLRLRLQILKGAPHSIFDEAAAQAELSEGLQDFIRVKKMDGGMNILISSGGTCFTAPVAARAGFDSHHGNEFLFENGVLSGDFKEPVLDKHAKRALVLAAAAEANLAPEKQCSFMGDGSNDLLAIEACGLGGVGYRLKETLWESDQVINLLLYNPLSVLLYAQGYTEDEIRRMQE